MGVVHRHKNICANLTPIQTEMRKYEKWARPFQPVRILDMLPLSHLFGQSLAFSSRHCSAARACSCGKCTRGDSEHHSRERVSVLGFGAEAADESGARSRA